MQTLEPRTAPWLWPFYSEAALKHALQDYTEYVMAQGAPPDGGDPDPTKRDRAYRIYAQNREIDRRMGVLEDIGPWRLLESYYRRGQCIERKGWVETLRFCGQSRPNCPGPVRCRVEGDDRLDLPTCRVTKDCRAMRDQFEIQISRAIATLFSIQ